MTDNELFALVRTFLLEQLPLNGLASAQVLQAYQPTQQGVPGDASTVIYLHKLYDRRYGYLKREDVYDEDAEEFVHTETQPMETAFQVNAVVPLSLSPASLTASDVVNVVCGLMQSAAWLTRGQENDVATLRVVDVRLAFFQNDKDQHQADPSFDFVLLHKRATITTTPAVYAVEAKIRRV